MEQTNPKLGEILAKKATEINRIKSIILQSMESHADRGLKCGSTGDIFIENIPDSDSLVDKIKDWLSSECIKCTFDTITNSYDECYLNVTFSF